MQTETCLVLDKLWLSSTAFELKLLAPSVAPAAWPGQFVNIDCGKDQVLMRPISVCDAQGDTLRLVVAVRGQGTLALSQIKPGDTVKILGPLGNGFSLPEGDGRVLLVGGGVGVPPMVFLSRVLGKRVDLCMGFQNKDCVLIPDGLTGVCCGVGLCTDDGSLGVHGRVDKLVRPALAQKPYACVMACGPRPMLRAVADLCKERNIPCQVCMEERMGCGVGACLVCACKTKHGYAHVCSDGPVFDANEVIWDE